MKARFHLPGIATHFKFNLIFATVLEQYPQYFRDFEIASFYGAFPQSIWNGGRSREPELLANCYRNSLKLAAEKGIKTVAFPSISTGVYSYPLGQAAEIAVRTVAEFAEAHPGQLNEIFWVLFDSRTKEAYDRALKDME